MKSSPVVVCSDERVSASAVAWRYQGRLQLSVVVKATFSLSRALLLEAQAVVAEDVQFDRRPTRSVERASEIAPYLARCDVLLTGHAYPPGDAPASTSSARLAVFRDRQPLLDKTLHVFGDRGADGRPAPFAKMPLVYERALGGPGSPNPVGVEQPNVVDPGDPTRPAGFAPVSRYWAARKRLVVGVEKQRLDAPIADLPDSIPWAYFQAAPLDQQIEYLRGGEWIVLDGLRPGGARIQAQIPERRGAARVASVGSQEGLATVDLLADMLVLAPDEDRFCVVWRGRYEVAGGDGVLPSLRVLASLETPGEAIDWRRIESSARAPAAPAIAPVAAPVGERTVALVADAPMAAVASPAAPFPLAAAGARQPIDKAATPWGGAPIVPVAVAAPGEMTHAPARAPQRVGEETMPIASRHAPASASAPFPLQRPGGTPQQARVPGAPWSGIAATPAPRPTGEGTMSLDADSVHAVAPPPLIAPAPAPPAPLDPAPAPRPPSAAPPAAPARVVARAPAPRREAPNRPAAAAKPAPKPAPKEEGFAGRLKAAGAKKDDVEAMLRALQGPQAPPPDED